MLVELVGTRGTNRSSDGFSLLRKYPGRDNGGRMSTRTGDTSGSASCAVVTQGCTPYNTFARHKAHRRLLPLLQLQAR